MVQLWRTRNKQTGGQAPQSLSAHSHSTIITAYVTICGPEEIATIEIEVNNMVVDLIGQSNTDH